MKNINKLKTNAMPKTRVSLNAKKLISWASDGFNVRGGWSEISRGGCGEAFWGDCFVVFFEGGCFAAFVKWGAALTFFVEAT